MRKIIILVGVVVLLISCSPSTYTPKSQTYAAMYSEKPVAILVMPPINRSTKVEAKELFYSSLVVPLTLKGYYVMPPLLTMEILKEESAYDSEMFENASMKNVGDLFGVDAVLFTTIHDWNKTTIASQVRVTVEYALKSTKTDEVIFNRQGDIIYTPNSGGGGLIGLVADMVTTAFTKEIELGRKCNVYTLSDMPAGKYSPSWDKDGETAAGAKSFTVRLQ